MVLTVPAPSRFLCVRMETLSVVLKVPEAFQCKRASFLQLFKFNNLINTDLLLLQRNRKLLISSSSPREKASPWEILNWKENLHVLNTSGYTADAVIVFTFYVDFPSVLPAFNKNHCVDFCQVYLQYYIQKKFCSTTNFYLEKLQNLFFQMHKHSGFTCIFFSLHKHSVLSTKQTEEKDFV